MSTTGEIKIWNSQEPNPASETPAPIPGQLELRKMVLDSVGSPHSRRNYAKALDLLFAFAAGRPLTRGLLLEYWTSMEDLAPSTVNVRLAAVRKMVTEAKRNGLLSAEEASNLTDVPNVRQRGTRLGNWLTKEQARELLAVPDRSLLKGKRDYAILALLVGCALRRRELASLTVEDIQQRETAGSSPIFAAKADGSAPSPSRSGSSRGSTPGRSRPGSKRVRCCDRSARSARWGRA